MAACVGLILRVATVRSLLFAFERGYVGVENRRICHEIGKNVL